LDVRDNRLGSLPDSICSLRKLVRYVFFSRSGFFVFLPSTFFFLAFPALFSFSHAVSGRSPNLKRLLLLPCCVHSPNQRRVLLAVNEETPQAFFAPSHYFIRTGMAEGWSQPIISFTRSHWERPWAAVCGGDILFVRPLVCRGTDQVTRVVRRGIVI